MKWGRAAGRPFHSSGCHGRAESAIRVSPVHKRPFAFAMSMDTKTHWEKIYSTKAPESVSWYAPHLETWLALIESAAGGTSASIIDVGRGESTLVDDLLARGYRNITMLDLALI